MILSSDNCSILWGSLYHALNVLQFNPRSSLFTITQIASGIGGNDITFNSKDGSLYVVPGDGSIVKCLPTGVGGATTIIPTGTIGASLTSGSQGIAITSDTAGNLHVLPGDNTVQQISNLSAITPTITPISTALPAAGAGIVYSPYDGNLYTVCADGSVQQLKYKLPHTFHLKIGSGGMSLGPSTVSTLMPSGTTQLELDSDSISLNSPLTLSSAWTGLGALASTEIHPGGVIRLSGISGYNTLGGPWSGFTGAFGIPAPIWGYRSPWVIITPNDTIATYAFRSNASETLGWADGIAPNDGYSITSAIVMDTTSLAALVAATAAATLQSTLTPTGSVYNPTGPVEPKASASGILSYGSPNGNGSQWNIGINACGTSGFSVPGSSLQALIAATNGGKLVVANGATIS